MPTNRLPSLPPFLDALHHGKLALHGWPKLTQIRASNAPFSVLLSMPFGQLGPGLKGVDCCKEVGNLCHIIRQVKHKMKLAAMLPRTSAWRSGVLQVGTAVRSFNTLAPRLHDDLEQRCSFAWAAVGCAHRNVDGHLGQVRIAHRPDFCVAARREE